MVYYLVFKEITDKSFLALKKLTRPSIKNWILKSGRNAQTSLYLIHATITIFLKFLILWKFFIAKSASLQIISSIWSILILLLENKQPYSYFFSFKESESAMFFRYFDLI